MKRISYEELRIFLRSVLHKAGVSEYSASCLVGGLSETSLRGVDSHGIRLFPHYLESALTGRKNGNPSFKIIKKYPSFIGLDADNAFGLASGMKAVDEAQLIADVQGICAVSVFNSSHPGALAAIGLRAARNGFAFLGLTHADALVVPEGGSRPFLGTNPICFCAPRLETDPFCLDMATSIIPWNKIKLALGSKELLQEGVAVDAEGVLTIDPQNASALIPVGGYKGFGLSTMVEILCAMFSGMRFGPHIPSMYKSDMKLPRKLGQFYVLMKTDAVGSDTLFLEGLQRLSEELRQQPLANGGNAMIAGDPEIQESKLRLRYGIPVDKETWGSFEAIAKTWSVEMPAQHEVEK